jgi:hypothetical protein
MGGSQESGHDGGRVGAKAKRGLRANGPVVFLGALFVVSVSTRCSSRLDGSGSTDAGASSGASSGASTSGASTSIPPIDEDSGSDAGLFLGVVSSDASGETDAADAALASDSGPVSCPADGGACDIPPSICRDSNHAAYFTNPRCVDGLCAFDMQTLDCPSGCNNGGCILNVTK